MIKMDVFPLFLDSVEQIGKIIITKSLMFKSCGTNNGDSGSNVFILQVNVIFAETFTTN